MTRYDEQTKKMVAKMLKEPVGHSLVDSGGIYGYHHDANKDRDFDKEPEITLDTGWGGINPMISLYHWLCQTTEYHPVLDRLFQRWYNDPSNDKWGSGCELWVTDVLAQLKGVELGGEWTTPNKPTFSDNSYNHETMLSQGILFSYFEIDESDRASIAEGSYAIISVHGGCDVRGGYTTPRVFRVFNDDMPCFIELGDRASLYCEHCRIAWDTDDAGYSWHTSEDAPDIDRDVEVVAKDDPAWNAAMSFYKITGNVNLAVLNLFSGAKTRIVAINDHEIICPVCGKTKLSLGI